MIYATVKNNLSIVAAADNVAELEAFFESQKGGQYFISKYQPTEDDMYLPEFLCFRMPPYVFEHTDSAQAKEFLFDRSVKVVSEPALIERHRSMLDALEEENGGVVESDTRTIAEILDLVGEGKDRWDTRSPEEIEKDKDKQEEYKKIADAARKAGTLTDDSFVPEKGSKVGITDIRSVQHADGSVTIDRVLAVTDHYKNNGLSSEEIEARDGPTKPVVEDTEEVFYRFDVKDDDMEILGELLIDIGIMPNYSNLTPLENYQHIIVKKGQSSKGGWFTIRGEKNANKMCGTLDRHNFKFGVKLVDAAGKKVGKFVRNDALAQQIEPEGRLSVFYRIDFDGLDIWEIDHLLPKDGKLDVCAKDRGETKEGSWVVVLTQKVAEEIRAIVAATHSTVSNEVYAINEGGERILPKGSSTTVVDPNAVVILPPRPWNNRTNELETMTLEELAENTKTVKASEFIFCGWYNGSQDGTVVYICPKSYFLEHEVDYDGPLNISHLLPRDLKEIGNGIYTTKSQNYENLSMTLALKGFRESLMFNIYLNNL